MKRPALIVIDMVNDFLANWPEGSKTRLLAATNDLVRFMRERDYPIIWVRQEFEPDLRDAFPEMISKENTNVRKQLPQRIDLQMFA